MCGINVAIGNPRRVIEMNKKLSRRGIRSKYEIYEHIGIGAIRLPIQGLDVEYDSPFHLKNEHDIVLFNGEIYNFKEINETFKSDIDVFNLDIGPEFYDGDFAYIIFNDRDLSMRIVTDRFGKKQLYYKIENGKITGISSEVKGLISKNDKINMKYISTVARFGYVFDSDETIVKNIKRFYPGKEYIINSSGIIDKINDIPWDSSKLIPSNINKSNLSSLINLSVKRRLISDIPVAIVFSGGLDSSIVLYHSLIINKNIKVFTIFNKGDYKYAKRYADKMNVKIEKINFSTDKIMISEAHLYNESAIDLGSVIPKFLLFNSIKNKKFNVVIGGTGADEIFGGYGRMFSFDYQQNDIFNELIYYHLPRVEKMSMANTIEYRTPFTADYIIDFGLQLPYKERINKKYLRDSYRDILPDYIVNRKKEALKTNSIRKDEKKERMKLIKLWMNKLFEDLKNVR